jgi:hypothetical protein
MCVKHTHNPIMSCQICCNDFNKTTRAKTTCPSCEYELCRTCLTTYLEGDISDVPLCPSCKHGWEREFLDTQLTRSYRFGTYKEHREKVLCDRQKSQLPATQQQAANYIEAKKELEFTSAEIVRVRKEIGRLTLQETRLSTRHWHAKRTTDTYGRIEFQPREEAGTTAGGAGTEGTAGPAVAVPPRERATPAAFIKPCPAPECRGFLSTAWKCGLCSGWSCPDCHEFKGPEKDVPHTCDPGHVATALLLAREAKSCPKCGVSICKIEGCDQMWCTACNTGFSWRTGRVAEGPVHNPHYFAYLRSQGQDPNARPAAAGGPPMTCEEETDRAILRALDLPTYRAHYRGHIGRNRPSGNTDRDYLTEAWRIMREEQDEMRRDAEDSSQEKLRILRVKLMLKEITEEDWKHSLQRIEKDGHFKRAVTQVREVFVGASRDIIRGVLTAGHDLATIRLQLERLIEYCNTSFKAIRERFSRKANNIVIKLPEPVSGATV